MVTFICPSDIDIEQLLPIFADVDCMKMSHKANTSVGGIEQAFNLAAYSIDVSVDF